MDEFEKEYFAMSADEQLRVRDDLLKHLDVTYSRSPLTWRVFVELSCPPVFPPGFLKN